LQDSHAFMASASCNRKEGKYQMIRILTIAVLSMAVVSLGACAKKEAAPAPASTGMSK